MDIIIAIINWLHLLATIIWIGAMIILLLIIIPSVKDSLQDKEISNKFMKSIGKKMTFLVNISIILLIITGIFLGIFIPMVKEIKSTDWVILLIIKHAVVFIMVVIHICRLKVIAPLIQIKGKENPTSKSYLKLKSLQMNLVWVNLVLGMITLFISVIL